MSGVDGTAVDLREIDTPTLQRELKERDRCVDCQTQHATGWVPAGVNRIRCKDCHEQSVSTTTGGSR